ncbi:MAG TPA: hypothetical protein VFY14_15490 [Streptomyces sp.]|nr:hypothetical protein [Streptomyces sp.]
MSARKKDLPPPTGGTDLTALLRSRHVGPGDPPPEARPAPADASPRPARTRAKGPEMDRRSWYMPKESADALAAAVDDLHFATRQPKHVILAALVSVALDRVDEVRARIEFPEH